MPAVTVVATGIGTLVEGYELLLYAYLAAILAEQFFPPGDPTAALLATFAIFAVGFVARPVGGLVFGHVGDRHGRRTALVASLLLMAVGTMAIGLLPTYDKVGVLAPALLLVCRLVQGLSVGGEYVGANIMIIEHAGANRSGRAVSANQVASYLGAATAATISLLLAGALTRAQLTEWGWRLPFLAAGPLGLIGLYLRIRVPESLTRRVAGVAPRRFPVIAAVRSARRGMVVFAGWLTMVTLGGYLVFGYLPTYLVNVVGLTAAGAYGANLAALASLGLGAVAGGFLVDRCSTRRIAIASAIGVAVTVGPSFLLMQHGSVAAAVFGQLVWAWFIGVAATVSALLSASEFPEQIRFTATALAYNVTVTLLGGTAPYLSTWLVARTGNPVAPSAYLVVMALIALATAVLGLRPRPAAGTGFLLRAGPR